MKFTDYVSRFIRIASRWEEDAQGSTNIGYRTMSFIPEGPSCQAQLGSGIVSADDQRVARELSVNAARVEAWRRTPSYKYCVVVCSWRAIALPRLTVSKRISKRLKPPIQSKDSTSCTSSFALGMAGTCPMGRLSSLCGRLRKTCRAMIK